MEKKRPILSVRPQFDPGLAMVQSLMAAGVLFLPVTIVGGMLVYILFTIVGLAKFIPASGVFGFFLIMSIAGIPPLFYEIKKRALQRTLYNFYDDYIDFQYFHFYLNRRRGRVRYRDVTDINQHASALQEQRRLTTIYLYVPTMSFARGFSGVKMEDLPQSKGYLTKVMDLIEASLNPPVPAWDAAPAFAYQVPVAPVAAAPLAEQPLAAPGAGTDTPSKG
ncbi:MAG: hypothetical protein PW788_02395 [Micavibrio sp.]|nr:hypothetical protein [Micavibrio sp.]